jgi:membrane protease YdiL (CAAX protease family)
MVVGLMALAFAGGSLQAEVGQRQVVAGALASEQMIRMVPLLLVAGATEEIAFRGFLLPRLRITLGRWITAVLAGAALFGSGHFTAAAGGCDPLSALGRCPPKRATESL